MLILAAALGGSPSGTDTPEGLHHLRLCASCAGDGPVIECQKALDAGLGPASTAEAYTLLGLFAEPDPELELFDRQRKAEAFYRAALAASPRAAVAAFRLGQLLGRNSEALRWLDHAARLRPDWVPVHVARAWRLQAMEREDEAIAALEAAARADLEEAPRWLMWAGEIEAARGRNPEAERLYRRAAATHPQDIGICVGLGSHLSNSGQKAEATAVLLAGYANRAHANGELLSALSSWLRVVGRYDEALRAAQDAAAVLPDSTGVLRTLAFAQREKGRLEEALATYRHWHAVAPGDYIAYSDHGQALTTFGRLEEAIGVYRRFYDALPQHRPEAANLLGQALAAAGRYEEAVPILKEATGQYYARESLASALRKLGRIEEAAAIEKELAHPERPDSGERQ